MTERYRVLSGLTVRHPYFSAGWTDSLHLQADRTTEALMSRFGLLLRGDARRFVMLASDRGLDGLWSERADWPEGGLQFLGSSSDPLWSYYTDLRAMASTGSFPLAFALSRPECKNQSDWLAEAPVDVTVTLPVRKTYWKYVLVGDWGPALQVSDATGVITFSASQQEVLPDATTVTVIRSTVPIALAERPCQRFQLARGVGAQARVLMARLPLASPAALRRELVDGALCDVSEIFVNR